METTDPDRDFIPWWDEDDEWDEDDDEEWDWDDVDNGD